MTKENSQKPAFLLRQTEKGDAQIAYFSHAFKTAETGNSPAIVFCGGFNSNMRGSKATHLKDLCEKNQWDYYRFDYQGHGESSGAFIDGTIGDWFADALHVIDEVTKGPLVLVGSSMGGWMSLLLSKMRPERIKGLILIAPAPDFPLKLMWPRLDDEIRSDLETKGVWYRPSLYEGEEPYPITYKFIQESKNQNVLDDPIPFDGPVHILQGTDDEAVPMEHAFKVSDALTSNDVTIEIIKNGDHRLSSPEELIRLGQRIETMMIKLSD